MLLERPHRRIRIIVAYDGTDFHGWQNQVGLVTIQGTLEDALSTIAEHSVQVDGSGRTDAGVHAEAQVAAFSLRNPIPVLNLRRAINRLLPPSIRVLEAGEVQFGFHPRFDALAKTYEYRLHRAEVCPPWIWRYVHHHPYPLDLARVAEAAQVFRGEHDFTAFASSDESDVEGRSKVRMISLSRIDCHGDLLCFRVRGNGFLKHMVRNLMGALLECGKGNLNATEILHLLDPANGAKCIHSAPAKGLHLLSVEYGKEWTL